MKIWKFYQNCTCPHPSENTQNEHISFFSSDPGNEARARERIYETWSGVGDVVWEYRVVVFAGAGERP